MDLGPHSPLAKFPNPCHPERSARDVGARTESKDPENLSLTMRRQGILPVRSHSPDVDQSSECRQLLQLGLTE